MFSIKSTFNPSKDIPDLAGRVYLITGGTTGLGLGTVENIAAHSPRHIFIMARNTTKGNEIVSRLKGQYPTLGISFIKCDMADLHSVKSASKDLLASTDRLDVLMCNSGICARAPATTTDGYEIQFQVNHIGHALLIKLLLPVMLATAAEPAADVRIVNVSSQAYREVPASGIDFDTLKSDQAYIAPIEIQARWRRYGQSKLANMLYARSLAVKYPDILSISVHPGYVLDTEIGSAAGWLTMLPARIMSIGRALSVEEGSHTQLWAATAPKEGIVNGEYYEPFGILGTKTTVHSKDNDLAERLWDWTQKELADYS